MDSSRVGLMRQRMVSSVESTGNFPQRPFHNPLAWALCASFLAFGCAHTVAVSPRATQEARACRDEIVGGDLRAAESHCKLGLEFAPNSSDLLTDLGLIHYLRGEREAAKGLFIRAIHNNPNAMQAYADLGQIALDERDNGIAEA